MLNRLKEFALKLLDIVSIKKNNHQEKVIARLRSDRFTCYPYTSMYLEVGVVYHVALRLPSVFSTMRKKINNRNYASTCRLEDIEAFGVTLTSDHTFIHTVTKDKVIPRKPLVTKLYN